MTIITYDVLVVLLREHWVQLVTGLLLPLAVGFATKLHAPPAIKALINFLLALATGAMEAIVANHGKVDIEQIVAYVLAIWGISHQSYKMIWKPVGGGVSDPVRLATPDIGAGPSTAASGARSA